MLRQKEGMESMNNHKGSIIRLCGVVFMFVGILDSMLLWRGGLVGHGFYFLLIGTGVLLYVIGSIVRQRGASQRRRNASAVTAAPEPPFVSEGDGCTKTDPV